MSIYRFIYSIFDCVPLNCDHFELESQNAIEFELYVNL